MNARSSSVRSDDDPSGPNRPSVLFPTYIALMSCRLWRETCCMVARHEVATRNINIHRTKICTATPTHSDLSTDGFQCRVTTNPERLAEEESIEMTIDGKSCKSSELKLSG